MKLNFERLHLLCVIMWPGPWHILTRKDQVHVKSKPFLFPTHVYMPGLKSYFKMSTNRKKDNLTGLPSVLMRQITLHFTLSEVSS